MDAGHFSQEKVRLSGQLGGIATRLYQTVARSNVSLSAVAPTLNLEVVGRGRVSDEAPPYPVFDQSCESREMRMKLYHYSEDPALTIFHPHVAKTSAVQNEAYVWAIDEWHSPMYYVPRDCPRACFWAGERTTADDRDRWLHGLEPRFVMAVESGWVERIRSTVLHRYEVPAEKFTPRLDDSGHYVCRETVVPVRVEPMADLLGAIVAEGVELRVVDRLGPMWRRVHRESTLHFSGTRLRNARGYPLEFGVE